MSEPEHEHDEDEAAESPVSLETVSEADEEEADAEAAETFSEDAAEVSEGEAEMSTQPGTAADAKAQRDQQKAVDKMFDSFEREADRHTKRVSEIAGDSAPDLLQCPMCSPDEGFPNMPGWLLPVPPSEEKIAAIRTAIGLAPKIDYKPDPYSHACETCGGLGSVLSGAQVQGQDLLPCFDCGNRGWIANGEERGGGTPNGASATGVTGPTVPQLASEPEPPEAAALKARGYTVIAPYTVGG